MPQTAPIPEAVTPQADLFNPISEAKKRLAAKYPAVASMTDQQIYQQLQSPTAFRSAFPEYGKLRDEDIQYNMARIGQRYGYATTPPPETPTIRATGRPSLEDRIIGNLPLIGEAGLATVGGIGAGPPGAGAGAVAGRAIGEEAKQILRPNTPKPTAEDELLGLGAAGAMNLVGEGVARGVTSAAQKTVLPFLSRTGMGSALAGRVLPKTPVAVSAAEHIGVPLTAGERAGSAGTLRFERVLGQTIMGRKPFEEIGKEQIAAGERGFRTIADSVASKMTPDEVGSVLAGDVKTSATAFQAKAQQLYADLDKAAGKGTAQATIVDLRPFKKQAAKRLQEDLLPLVEGPTSLPSLKSQESPAYKALQDVTQWPDFMTFSDAHVRRSVLRQAADSDRSVLGDRARGPIKELVSNLHDQMEVAAKKAGIYKQWRATDRWYRMGRARFDDDLVTAIAKNDPEKIVNAVKPDDLNISSLRRLEKIVPQQDMRRVGRTLLEKMQNDAVRASPTEGNVMMPETLAKSWNSYGDATKKLLYGQQGKEAIDQFVSAMERASPTISWASQVGTGIGYIVQVAQGGLIFNIGREAYRGIQQNDVSGHLANIAETGIVLMSPRVLAHMLTTPSSARLLARAIQMQPWHPEAGAVAARLFAAYVRASGQEIKEDINREGFKLEVSGTPPPMGKDKIKTSEDFLRKYGLQ